MRLLVLADAKGATQAISFQRPLDRLVTDGRCQLELVDEARVAKQGAGMLIDLWHKLKPTTLVISRYAGGLEAPVVAQARRDGVPVVYHIDDNLFAVPEDLGPQKFARYNDPKRVASLTAAMTAADFVYASTPELARQLRERLPGLLVRPGDIYCAHRVVARGRRETGADITVGYMGTSGHARDLDMVVPAIVELLEQHPRLRFETFGTIKMPASLVRFGRRVAHHAGTTDYDEFMRRLANIGWHIGLAPVIDTPFNRCKADTKWVEYTAAGIAVVASDLPVYQRACAGGAGLLVAPDDWGQAIERLITDEETRGRIVNEAQQRVVKHYSPARLEQQLIEMFSLTDLSMASQ